MGKESGRAFARYPTLPRKERASRMGHSELWCYVRMGQPRFLAGPLLSHVLLLAGVGDVPDAAGAVVGDEEAAVAGYGYAYGTAPDLAVLGDEAG